MKNLKFTLLFLVWLQLLSFNLMAQNAEGRFNLKEGDWFEVQVKSPLKTSDIENSPLALIDQFKNTELNLLLRYQLEKQLTNGNQVYRVSMKRVRGKAYVSHFNAWMGYDSYYPPFEDNEKHEKSFIEFDMEVASSGSIIRFDSVSGTPPFMKFDEIRPKKMTKISVVYSFVLPSKLLEITSTFLVFVLPKSGTKSLNMNEFDKDLAIKTTKFSETDFYNIHNVTVNDSIHLEYKFLKKEGIPVENDFMKLVDASFPIPANTLIKGKLPEAGNADITIGLIGYNNDAYFTNKHFKTQSDGSFNCPIYISSPFELNIQIGSKAISSFIEPNDTLEILSIPNKTERLAGNATFYDQPTMPGYMINSGIFAGNAANNALLSFEMNEWMKSYPMPESVQAYDNFRDELTKKTDELISKYNGKASNSCIDYFKSTRNYYLANCRFAFYEEQQLNTTTFNLSESSFELPTDFFAEVDTIPTVMYAHEWCWQYRSYIDYVYDYKKQRLGASVGGLSSDFYGNYYFARASLKGFPLYTALYKSIEKELRSGFIAAKKIEPLYHDFMNNCNNPLLTEPLALTHETVIKLEIGKPFPVKSFIQTDSTVFDLSIYKGKPVCLVILNSRKNRINNFKKEMDKFKNNEVEFLFVLLPNLYTDKGTIDSEILAMPNVKIIEILDHDIKDNTLFSGISKIFVLDKWLRIVDDAAKDPSNHVGSDSLENAIKKAIQTKRFSKQEQASIIKTAGWSLGSILFTVLIGLWVYRVRVRRLKQKEAAKRRIKELEIKAVRSQMNPHFIFNALNSIQSLINGNQFKEANIYLSKFAVLLRGVLHNSEKATVTLTDELQAVELYCQLEQLRFGFKFEIGIDPDVDGDLIEIPGMIIQPLVENAIVHGLSPKGNEGELTVRIEKQNGKLCVCVTDNGIGLMSQELDVLRQKGFGLKLVEERINILNLDGKEAKLMVENRSNTTGTMATLIIPID
jgi:hypothetical protein